jgi:radical SAM protein with 4Fe4S-binding SPASM domain
VIVRYEPWGAWVRLEKEAAIVALDRDGVRALGLDGRSAWDDDGANAMATTPSAPLEIHLAVTSKCAAGCDGCYLDARADGEHVPRASLLATLDAMHEQGVFTVAFGGGEPTLREDLGELAEDSRARGITPVLTTSGLGLTDAKIERLRSFAQVNVSYDGIGADYEEVRGFDGGGAAERAIARLAAAGIRVGVNVVLTCATFPSLPRTLARARELGAIEAQLLRYKPAGRAAKLDYLARRLTPEQVMTFPGVLRELSREHATDGAFRIRIDCALVPFLSADPELALRGDDLARLGVFGCEAGGALAAVRADGRVAPCSFAAPTSLRGEDLGAHAGDPELERWRAYVAAPQEPCASCTLRAVCKGGCKIVSSYLDGAHGPDPECPRVRAARAEDRAEDRALPSS